MGKIQVDTQLRPETCHGRWMDSDYKEGLVSVIVPVYNRAHIIEDTLDSTWDQTHRPIEVLVVDDGSTDNTGEAVKQWNDEKRRTDDFELRYLRQRNKGAPAARNLGLIHSRGQYIQFLDSDDLLGPDKLKRQVQALAPTRPGTAAYGPHVVFAKKDGRYVTQKIDDSPAEDPLEAWLRCLVAPPHTFLWKRADLHRQGPWDESLIVNQDIEYGFRFIVKGGSYVFVPEAWGYRRKGMNRRKSVGSQRSIDSIMCRIDLAERFLRILRQRDMLCRRYRIALAHRFYCWARMSALRFPALARFCLSRISTLVGPDRWNKPWLYLQLSRLASAPAAEDITRMLTDRWKRYRRRARETFDSIEEMRTSRYRPENGS